MASALDALLAITPEEVATWPANEQRWYENQLERELTLRSPADFATRLSRGLWQPYQHLIHTSDRIVAMVEDDATDCLIVEEPVRHGKTLTCSRWAPAWFITKFQKRVLLASYEADFASTHGRAAREIVAEHGPTFGVTINDTSRAAHRWELIGADGGMNTAGAGGPITGKGGHLCIIDDPIKNSEEADSAIMREKLWDWWQNTWLTRREPGAKMLVIMSRWHADDLVGRLLAAETGMRIERLRLPAIAEDNDPLGRRPGDALCRERYDEEALAGIRTDIGPRAWASLYQQRPTLEGGGTFKRANFRYWSAQTDGQETFYSLGDTLVPDSECWRFATMDPAFSGKRQSDFTTLATWAVAPTDPMSLILLDMKRVRVKSTEHQPMIREVWDTMRPAWIGVEKQAATMSLFTEVQREGVVVRWLHPDKNKYARAETASTVMEAGRVWFPRNAPWLADFEDELLTFPVGKHDDQVDVVAYAAIEMAKRTIRPHKVKSEPTNAADAMWEKVKKRDRGNRHHPVIGRM